MSASRRGVDFGGEIGSATVSTAASGAEREVTKDLKSSSNVEGRNVSLIKDVYLKSEKIQTIVDRSMSIIAFRSAWYLLVRSKFNHSLILVSYPPNEWRVQHNQGRMNPHTHLAYP